MSPKRLRARRGSALILVLLMTLAVAALAVAAIYMSGSAGLLSRFYDRERQYAYAAQSGIERALAELARDTSFTAGPTTPTLLVGQTLLQDAAGDDIPGATVRVWMARTGDTTSSGPITLSLLAQVADAGGTRFARRVDIERTHLAQWTFLANSSTTSNTLPFESATDVVGRVHVNGSWDRITNATYRDTISATGTVSGNGANPFRTARVENDRPVAWPADDALLDSLEAVAGDQGLAFTVSDNDRTRLELVWRDTDGDGIAERNEGFARVFDLTHSSEARLRVQPLNLGFYLWNDPIIQNQCGAFYRRNGRWQFFPVATHRAAWAWAIIDSTAATPARPVNGDQNNQTAVRNILRLPTARCFPAGSPYLVNTERFTDNGGTVGTGSSYRYPFGAQVAAHRYGGDDTTFTQVVQTCTINNGGTQCQGAPDDLGAWRTLSAVAGQEALAPLDRNGVGAVLYFSDDIRLSGVAAGRITVAVRGDVDLVDRLLHAGGPNGEQSDCAHLVGVVAEDNIRVVANPIAHRVRIGTGGGPPADQMATLGGADFFELHGAMLSLTGDVAMQDEDFMHWSASGQPLCQGSRYSAGCIQHVGAAAMQRTDEFSGGNGEGGRYILTPDACLVRGFRPPWYPAGNRYRVVRTVDVRPGALIGAGAVEAHFAGLQGAGAP